MPRSKGFQGIVAREKGTTWGVATAAGSGDAIEVISCVPSGGLELIDDRQITGRVTQRRANAGIKQLTLTLMTALRYEGNGREIAYVLGTAGVPSTVDTTGKKHTFKIKDSLDGVFNTLAYENLKDTKVEECKSAKWR